ncbi:MAG: flavodoxin family protein [Planctomycetota bacterium]|jgi:flavodoxin
MAKGLVVYYSRSGNTKAMANVIAESMETSGLPTKCKSVADVKVTDLVDVDAIVVGSPTYYGRAAAPVAQLFDESVSKHGKLDGKNWMERLGPRSAVRPIPAAATKRRFAKLIICY